MSFQPRRVIAGLKTVAHGGILQLNDAELKELGLELNEILDFSICTNPFMPPPGIKEMMSTIRIERYPEPQSGELRRALSGRLRIPPENIIVGSGTTEVIRLIALTYLRRGDTVLILEPTYGEYEMACRLAGARLVKLHARENDDFSPRLEEITKLLRELRPRVVFIGNPNNPTGKYLSRDDIETILDNMKNSLLILDEAYVGFANARWNSLNLTKKNNVVILRSMTKEYGLPGLRLGYAVARREIIDSLCAVLPPWNTNIVAQEVGIAVLKQEEYLRQSLRKVKEAKRFLVAGLSRLGFKVLPSDTHYFLVKVGEATVVCRSLLKRRIFVRDGTSFGLPEYIRISPRIMPECVKLIEVFDGIIKSGENVI